MSNAENAKEPCKDLITLSSVKSGTGRTDIFKPEPDVYQQTRYRVGFRLVKGFALLGQYER